MLYKKIFYHICSYFKKSGYISAFFFMIFLFAACSLDAPAVSDGNISSAGSPSEEGNAPEVTSPSLEGPSAAPTPSTAPAADGFSVEMAAEQIRGMLPEASYDISLVSDALSMGNDMYYTFLVSQKGVAIEPLIIANQKTGELKCISADNVVSDISTHPLYEKQITKSIRWEGAYVVGRADGTLSKCITLTPLDNSRFEFTAYHYLETGTLDLSGIASIQGDSASFTSTSGTVLSFAWEGAELVILEQPASLEEGFAGTYHYAEDAKSAISQISMEEALQKLKSLPPKATGLTGDAEDYYFYVQDNAVIISDHLCYNILVYSETDNRLFYTTQFYVTVDGHSIYGIEPPASDSDDIKIFSIQ